MLSRELVISGKSPKARGLP